MKKRLLPLLLAVLLLTGCESVIKNDYLSVHPHVEPSAAPTEAPVEEAPPDDEAVAPAVAGALQRIAAEQLAADRTGRR